jgi:hypothetical protein
LTEGNNKMFKLMINDAGVIFEADVVDNEEEAREYIDNLENEFGCHYPLSWELIPVEQVEELN